MKRMNFDEYFMSMAYLASKRSTCLRRQVGAVLVKDNAVIATGYNGAPSKSEHCEAKGCIRQNLNIPSGERLDICRAVHAEQNALLQAAKHGVVTEGATMYITVTPCFTCGKMIVNAGIEEIVVDGDYPDERTTELFNEVGIKIRKL